MTAMARIPHFMRFDVYISLVISFTYYIISYLIYEIRIYIYKTPGHPPSPPGPLYTNHVPLKELFQKVPLKVEFQKAASHKKTLLEDLGHLLWQKSSCSAGSSADFGV